MTAKAAVQSAENIALMFLNWQYLNHQAEKYVLEGSSTADTTHPISCVIHATWAHQHRQCLRVAEIVTQGASSILHRGCCCAADTATCYKVGMSSSSGCRSELSFPCKSHQTVVTHTSVSVFSDCSFSGIPGMRPACTTSSFRQGMDKEKGSCLSHSARSSPSSSSHFDFSSYSVANDGVGLNIHGWDSHDESVL